MNIATIRKNKMYLCNNRYLGYSLSLVLVSHPSIIYKFMEILVKEQSKANTACVLLSFYSVSAAVMWPAL